MFYPKLPFCCCWSCSLVETLCAVCWFCGLACRGLSDCNDMWCLCRRLVIARPSSVMTLVESSFLVTGLSRTPMYRSQWFLAFIVMSRRCIGNEPQYYCITARRSNGFLGSGLVFSHFLPSLVLVVFFSVYPLSIVPSWRLLVASPSTVVRCTQFL